MPDWNLKNNWASEYIKELGEKGIVQFRPVGKSMSGLIESGELVTIKLLDALEPLNVGSIVLCKVDDRVYLHKVTHIDKPGHPYEELYLIGNNRGGINGWIPYEQIYGVCVKVEK